MMIKDPNCGDIAAMSGVLMLAMPGVLGLMS